MDKFLAGMRTREQFLNARLNTFKTFYAVLSPEQQKAFDNEFVHGPFGHHNGHPHRRHGDHDGV